MDVILHPLQRKRLIQDARVDNTIPEDLIRRQKSKSAQSVLDRHADEAVVVVVDDVGKVGLPASRTVTTAVDPDIHG